MRLELDDDDLYPMYQGISVRSVTFGHFPPEVQGAIAAVGKATFYRNKGTMFENYNVVYPPRRPQQ